MKFIQLLNKIDAKTMLDSQILRLAEYEKKAETEVAYEKALQSFGKKLDDIKVIKLIERENAGRLVVAYVKELGEDAYKYEAFVMNGDGERYGFELSSWGELLNTQVLEKSIELYGETEVAAEIFWHMTFFGLTEERHTKECEKLKQSLKEAEYEPPENYKSADEVFKELNESMKEKLGDEWVPRKERTAEEKKARTEKMRADWTECEKLYKILNECVLTELRKV